VTFCNRLKTSLNLPKIEPRPPCPPRIYNKLYAYFDRELTSTGRKRGRPLKPSSAPSRPLPERHIPSLERGLEGFKGNRTPRQGLRFGGSKKDQGLPKWVPPTIRALCAGLDAGKARPHVMAGVESILFLPCPGTEGLQGDQIMQEGQSAEAGMKGKLPALMAAVLLFAIARLTGKETDAKEYSQRVKTVIAILHDIRDDETTVAKVGEEEEAWDGWEHVTKKDVDAWLKEIGSKGWLRMDWWENMAGGTGVSGEVEEDLDEDVESLGEEMTTQRLKEQLWKTRSGTMKQDQYDYLDDARREQFVRWKQLMLIKIDNFVQRKSVGP
jgi:origin recognition complex subunit 6